MTILRRRKKPKARNPFKPKYETGRQRRLAEYARDRPIARQQTWDRDKGRCQFPTCQRYVTLDAAHIHEVTFRSHGGSATDIGNTLTLCGKCHGEMHTKIGGVLKRIVRLATGLLQFFERETGKSPWIDVTERTGV